MCNKVGYDSKEAAVKDSKFLHKITRASKWDVKKKGKKMYAYDCNFCGKWHLSTSKRLKGIG